MTFLSASVFSFFLLGVEPVELAVFRPRRQRMALGGPGAGVNNLLRVDGTSNVLLVDGVSVILLQ